jgi:hypothetical protein
LLIKEEDNASFTHNSAFFFFWMNESFIKPNTNYKHTREIWFKLLHGQRESPKQLIQKPLQLRLNAEDNLQHQHTS